MKGQFMEITTGELLEEEVELTFSQLCFVCDLPAERVLEFVEEGLVEPIGREQRSWRFSGSSVRRVHCAMRLERDLGVNLAGAALALELIDELSRLRQRLSRLDH
jgi:chaperone modulatory protein CbpM